MPSQKDKPFWGSILLYLALEDSQFRLNERLRIIGSRFSDRLHLVVRNDELLGTGFLWQLTLWKADHPDTKLIVIDTISRIKSAGKPGLNSYEQDTLLYGPLQEFANQNAVAIIAVTHYAKTKGFANVDPFERITGSTGLFGVSDAAWVLNGKRGEDVSMLRVTGRDISDSTFRLRCP